ncbi:MAG: CotH kinase family protein [Bacteroidales bacterium]|nr:CotH kinase family protein [Bacteroidales bacterium]
MRRNLLILMFFILTIGGCREKLEQPEPALPPAEEQIPEDPSPADPPQPQWPEGQTGQQYVWDDDCIPQIRIYVKLNEWNDLLADYDRHTNGSRYFRCDFVFDKDGVIDSIPDTGIRVRDNMDGMRPEGSSDGKHKSHGTQWGLSNYEVNFLKYVQNDLHTLRYVKGLFLKSCLNDPTYSRERFCYDTFRQYGIWTVSNNTYCRVSIKVEGDAAPAYLGVYQMIEPVNKNYLLARASKFEHTQGYLWKLYKNCYLNTTNFSSGTDSEDGTIYPYTLIGGQESLTKASSLLGTFIHELKNIPNSQFPAWIRQVCDVDFLLKTYAVNVALGMYDDFWNTGRNSYLYFCPTGQNGYKVWLIPHDYEMSLGNADASIMTDPGTQNPYSWGDPSNILMTRLMAFEEFRTIYTGYLLELCNMDSSILHYDISSRRILDLMYQVSPFTDNDTGINTAVTDRPGQYSSNQKYVLTDINSRDNFFITKSLSIAAAAQ